MDQVDCKSSCSTSCQNITLNYFVHSFELSSQQYFIHILLANNDGQISYEEFLSHFNEIVDSESGFTEVEAPESEDECDLLDENASIPGGKMKSAVKKVQNVTSLLKYAAASAE